MMNKKTQTAIEFSIKNGTITLTQGDLCYISGGCAKKVGGSDHGRVPYHLSRINFDNGNILSLDFTTHFDDCFKVVTLKPDDFGKLFFVELPTAEQIKDLGYRATTVMVKTEGDNEDEV